MHDGARLAADPREELATALDRFAFRTSWLFAFDGEPVSVSAAGGPPGDDAPLVQAIQATFYDRCYARRSGRPMAMGAADTSLVQRLAAANAGREGWDRGWTVFQLGPGGQVFVRKGERERMAVPGAFLTEAMVGMAPQVGAKVSLRVLRESVEAQPGYYFAFGETLDELADQLSIVRIYFNLRAETAPDLFGALTELLNRYQTPFQLKAPVAPAAYDRADAAVLYVGGRYFPIVARIVAMLPVACEDPVPLFTKRLGPGIGVAMEPGSGESFGAHRSRLVAEGLVVAWRRGTAPLPTVAEHLAASGLDPARLWLVPGAVDRFDFPLATDLP
ncbi:MAG TPA: T3SS effector HopA1 family protein [Amaricoccus sp.]|jgi:hypothetical protein|nr:T3SS effector HopA1 family protein [Amaricoccus sp.]